MQRRDFLKSFSIAGAALSAPAIITTATSATHRRTVSDLALKGRVHSNKRGIAGAAVTDGTTVTVTDHNGYYQLHSTNKAEFVYISTPRGYTFNHYNGIAAFYQAITARNGVFKADFDLEKLATDDHRHCFVVWADPQIKTASDAEQLKTTAAPDLKALVASYPKGTLFHGIGCGDLIWDRFELFDDYRQAVLDTGIPFFNVVGNHDLDRGARNDDASAKTFRQQFGPTHYSFNRGAIHYVVLDDVFFVGAEKRYIGYVTENQLQWLEQDLALVKPGSTVVVSLHIPTNTGEAARTGEAERLDGVVANRNQLYKLLEPFKVHIMSGHTHMNECWEEGNITEHVHGTVCGAWWTGPICTDGTPNGYGVYEVTGSELKWYYKATGKPKDHQIRIYARGKATAHPDDVAVNVWNCDAGWKVEWYEDDAPKGPMLQRVALDPLAVDLLADAAHPVKYKFVAPTLASHLFFATPSPGAKRITVKATDRFGNVYIETMPLWGSQVLIQSLSDAGIYS